MKQMSGRRHYAALLGIFLLFHGIETLCGPLPLLSAYLDDLLLMPLFLPLWAAVKGSKLGATELAVSLFVFILVFEVLLPARLPGFIRDVRDIAAYIGGALLYMLYVSVSSRRLK